jgi:tRNA pseudouridine32 synthase/23S rRNA pseudouridine746 synthase
VASDAGRIDLPLGCDWANRPLQKVDPEHGRPAVTDFTVLQRDPGSTLVRLAPLTGRSHQLRVHLLAMGHPILGDPFYGPAEARAAAPRLLLHAAELRIHQPYSGAPLHFVSAPPFE